MVDYICVYENCQCDVLKHVPSLMKFIFMCTGTGIQFLKIFLKYIKIYSEHRINFVSVYYMFHMQFQFDNHHKKLNMLSP